MQLKLAVSSCTRRTEISYRCKHTEKKTPEKRWCSDSTMMPWSSAGRTPPVQPKGSDLLRSNHTFSSCGQTKGKMLCYSDFGQEGSTFVKRFVACLLSPTDPSLGCREDSLEDRTQPVLRICLSHVRHHPKADF